jgi:hypothetical protein
MTTQTWQGVWLSDRPVDCNDTRKIYEVKAWVQVMLDLPEEAIAAYEWVEKTLDGRPLNKGYREWLLPATLVNAHARLTLLDYLAYIVAEEERYRLRHPEEE